MDQDAPCSTGGRRLVVVANRLPLQRAGDEWETSPGGLVRALLGVLGSRPGAWVGWTGEIDGESNEGVLTRTSDLSNAHGLADVDLHSVPLSKDEFNHFYERVANGALWPLFHDAIRESTFDAESWSVYRDVNARFARATSIGAAPGATVWIHDYHLLLVPAMLRELRPDLLIGFFLHIPFPPQELFMRMPWRVEILEGMLGADLIGFQRQVGAENFIALTKRLLEVEATDDTIHTRDGRNVHVGTFPIGIDAAEIRHIASDPFTSRRASDIRARLGNPEVVFLGVDRLDYTKGIDLRLLGFASLLRERHDVAVRGRPPVVLVQIAVPGREGVDSYVEERHTVEQLVGDINGEYSTIGYPVVHYLRHSLPLDELVPLYMAADVMLVTPRRDGMNLVAKEFVASRLDDTGVLILSEFAGASEALVDAILVNPHDPEAVLDAMRTALAMPAEEVSRRMAAMRASVSDHDVHEWARNFLRLLNGLSSHA
jgi:trehalose 6-phosphate synthase